MSREGEQQQEEVQEEESVRERIRADSAITTDIEEIELPPVKQRGEGASGGSYHENVVQTDLSIGVVAQEDAQKQTSGKYVKSMLYGGMDGLVSVFVSVAAVAGGGSAGVSVLIVLGLAKLLAGAISMGVGDWLATKAEVEHAVIERKRENWECENYIEGEVEEMVQLYVEKGLSEESARQLIGILSSHRKLFVDMMMVHELGIFEQDEKQVPWKHGVVNFGSFMVLGIIPLLAYLALIGGGTNTHNYLFYVTIAMTVFTLFVMGVIKSKLTDTFWLTSGISTVFFGCIGAAVGYGVSVLLLSTTGISIN